MISRTESSVTINLSSLFDNKGIKLKGTQRFTPEEREGIVPDEEVFGTPLVINLNEGEPVETTNTSDNNEAQPAEQVSPEK